MIAETTTRVRTGSGVTLPHSGLRPANGQPTATLPLGGNFHFAPGANSPHDRLPDLETRDERVVRNDRTASVAGAAGAKVSRRRQAVQLIEDDALIIRALVGFALLLCILGAGYLSVYAKVAYQGRSIHALQTQLTAETAKQHALIAEIGTLESPNRIAIAAQHMGMVMGGDQTAYVTLHKNGTTAMASAGGATFGMASPNLGISSYSGN